jgi:hypothetical protein
MKLNLLVCRQAMNSVPFGECTTPW